MFDIFVRHWPADVPAEDAADNSRSSPSYAEIPSNSPGEDTSAEEMDSDFQAKPENH